MPPKRATTTAKMNTSTAKSATSSSSSDGVTAVSGGRKRAQPTMKAKDKHEATILAVDVGSNSMFKSSPKESMTDMDRSLQIVNWIISRKIFTGSTDRFSLMFFGHESSTDEHYPNVYFHTPGLFSRAQVDWIRVLKNEVKPNPKQAGDYVSALLAAIEEMKSYAEGEPGGTLTNTAITLISNFGGIDHEVGFEEQLGTLAAAITQIGVELCVIGPDLMEEPKAKSHQVGLSFLRQLLPRVQGLHYTYHESLSRLQFFIPKSVAPRGQPFELELAKDLSVRVQLYVKNEKLINKISFDFCSADKTSDGPTQELKKVRLYETVGDAVAPTFSLANIDQAPDSAFTGAQSSASVPTGKLVQKEDIIKSYRYGSTLAVFDKTAADLAEFPREGKQLQLIAFVDRRKILPQFLLSTPRYILPQKDGKNFDQAAFNVLSSLVRAMIKQNVVAICRYAYNINSNPRPACLVPKVTKEENFPVLIHYQMPCRDDMRYYDFPDVIPPNIEDEMAQKLDFMDEYIDIMMLAKENGEDEKLRKREMHDPEIQYKCMTLREKALNPEKPAELSTDDKRALLEMLSPTGDFTAAANKWWEGGAKDFFPLKLNEETRMAAFAKQKKAKAASAEAPTEAAKEQNLRSVLATLDEEANAMKDEEFEDMMDVDEKGMIVKKLEED